MSEDPKHLPRADAARLIEESIETVRVALQDLKFGQVTLIVHEGRVTQIEVIEKKRLKLI